MPGLDACKAIHNYQVYQLYTRSNGMQLTSNAELNSLHVMSMFTKEIKLQVSPTKLYEVKYGTDKGSPGLF